MEMQYIEWLDSYGCGSMWHEAEEVKCIASLCISIGFILKEDENAVVIVPHYAPKNDEQNSADQVVGEMSIPKCSIKLRKSLLIA